MCQFVIFINKVCFIQTTEKLCRQFVLVMNDSNGSDTEFILQ